MTTTAIQSTSDALSLRQRAIAAYIERDAEMTENLERQDRERREQERGSLMRLIARTLGVTEGISIADYSWTPENSDYEMVELRATVDDLTFTERLGSVRRSSTSLCVLVPCDRGCGKDLWREVESIDDLGSIVSSKHEHDFACLQKFDDEGEPITDAMGNPLPQRQPATPRLSPEQKARQSIDALDRAAERLAAALCLVSQLEDQRALIKASAIKQMVESGSFSSATAAEKVVESHDTYANHRAEQRAAEYARHAAMAGWEAAKLTATLDVALCRAMGRDE